MLKVSGILIELAAEVPARPTANSPWLQVLIRRIADESPSWGEERIANELLLKIGIRVSPRTVNNYLPHPRGRPRGDLRRATFLRLHAQGIIACDFFIPVTATFRQLYVFVVIEHHSRRLLYHNVTSHPSTAWTLQQLREVVGTTTGVDSCFTICDCIFANQLACGGSWTASHSAEGAGNEMRQRLPFSTIRDIGPLPLLRIVHNGMN